MKFPTISRDAARDLLKKHKRGDPWTGNSFVEWIGEGDQINVSLLTEVAQRLKDVRHEVEAHFSARDKAHEFERRACVSLHETFPGDAVCASSVGFWLWFTFVLDEGELVNVVDWRFGGNPSKIDPVNYGLATQARIWEGLFARLWLRGEIGFDRHRQDDAYHVARRGDIDVWRSHVIRHEYGRCHRFARCLVARQNPYEDPTKRALTTDEIRELSKELRRSNATMSFELMPETSALNFLETKITKIKDVNA